MVVRTDNLMCWRSCCGDDRSSIELLGVFGCGGEYHPGSTVRRRGKEARKSNRPQLSVVIKREKEEEEF